MGNPGPKGDTGMQGMRVITMAVDGFSLINVA